jgi:hypothetical protein
MAFSEPETISRQPDIAGFGLEIAEDDATLRRLEILLAENTENARSKRNFRNEREKLEAELMRHPLDADKTFSYLGLLLGTLPPASLFARIIFETRKFRPDDLWMIGVLMIVNIVTAIVGYFSGKLIARMVTSIERYRWLIMVPILPLVGLLWGVMAGGAGGFVIFVFGAIFGAFIGGAVGAIALPLFVLFHRLMKRGEMIEAKHFLPLALGVTLSICSFMLGR